MSDSNLGGGKHKTRQSHCKYGHPFSKTNTYYRPSGGRTCRICQQRRSHERDVRMRKTNRVNGSEPSSVLEMSTADLHWLAGWLEGEGAFILRHSKGLPYPRISAASTDFDVLDHAKAITGVGLIYDRDKPHEHYKDQRVWMVVRKNDALELMRLLEPLMHSRRAETIRQILREMQSVR